MAIYWMNTAEVYPESGWGPENAFMAFDPEVRFPRFHMETGDETIGNVRLIEGGPQSGQWQWSMTVSLPGPYYRSPRGGTEPSGAWQLGASWRLTGTTCPRGRNNIRDDEG